MAIFSNKIVTAKFLDYPNNTVIEVLYEEDNNLIPFILEVDFTQDDFNDLLLEMSLDEIESISKEEQEAIRKDAFEFVQEEIQKKVEEYKKILRKEFDESIGKVRSDAAQEFRDNFLKEQSNSIDDLTGKDIFTYLIKNNENNDFVFDVKIHILEDADIVKSKDKKLKLAIRKAKTVFELIKIYEEFRGTL